jgi:hypothetical protein
VDNVEIKRLVKRRVNGIRKSDGLERVSIQLVEVAVADDLPTLIPTSLNVTALAK